MEQLESIALTAIGLDRVEELKPAGVDLASVGQFLDGVVGEYLTNLYPDEYFQSVVEALHFGEMSNEMKVKAEKIVQRYDILLDCLHQSLQITEGQFSLVSDVCVEILYICAAYSNSQDPWSTASCKRSAAKILETVISYRDEDSLQELIFRVRKPFLRHLRKFLKKGRDGHEWKSRPESVRVLQFICSFVDEETFDDDDFGIILPMLFTVTDDYSPKYRAFGLPLLFQFIDTLPTSYLKPYTPIIFKIFRQSFNWREECVVSALLPKAFTAVDKLDKIKKKSSLHEANLKEFWSVYLEELGRVARAEENKIVKQLYCKSLVNYIQQRSLRCCSVLSSLLPLIINFAQNDHPQVLLSTLDIIRELMTHTWPRVRKHFGKLLLCICHIYLTSRRIDMLGSKDNIKQQVLWLLLILKESDTEQLQMFLDSLKQMPELETLVSSFEGSML